MTARICIWLLAATCLLGPIAVAEDKTGPDASWHKYDVLIERNIFSRLRGSAAQLGREAEAPALPPPERFLVLTGIVRQDDDYMAFLEDTAKGTVMRVRAGDAVLEGRVASVTLDALGYAKNGGTVTVKVGQNLEAGEGRPTRSVKAAATGTGGSAEAASQTGPSSGSASDSAGDIVERLRQRRQKELAQ